MASAYYKWRHARYLSETDWEHAARGTDWRTYPWGNEPPMNRACYLRSRQNLQSCPVGAIVSDKCPVGVMDMGERV